MKHYALEKFMKKYCHSCRTRTCDITVLPTELTNDQNKSQNYRCANIHRNDARFSAMLNEISSQKSRH